MTAPNKLNKKQTLKQTFISHKFLPQKKFGQNFLVHQPTLNKIAKIAEITKKDLVLEIGAGPGNLTKVLAKKAKKVIAVEKDRRIIPFLQENLLSDPNTKIINRDILFLDIKKTVSNSSYKVVANLPYNITAPVLDKFLTSNPKPKIMVLMLQKEVAKRICAKPPKMNRLAILVQFYAKPEIISYIPKNYFWPQPRIDSAIVKISLKKNSELPAVNTEKFFKIIKTGFSHPRKKLANNFKKELQEVPISLKSLLEKRAENLSLKDWTRLTLNFKI